MDVTRVPSEHGPGGIPRPSSAREMSQEREKFEYAKYTALQTDLQDVTFEEYLKLPLAKVRMPKYVAPKYGFNDPLGPAKSPSRYEKVKRNYSTAVQKANEKIVEDGKR